jgi:hypothetical protein
VKGHNSISFSLGPSPLNEHAFCANFFKVINF